MNWHASIRTIIILMLGVCMSGCILSDKEYSVTYDETLGVVLHAWRPRLNPSEIHVWNPVLNQEMLLEEYEAWRQAYWAEIIRRRQMEAREQRLQSEANYARMQEQTKILMDTIYGSNATYAKKRERNKLRKTANTQNKNATDGNKQRIPSSNDRNSYLPNAKSVPPPPKVKPYFL